MPQNKEKNGMNERLHYKNFFTTGFKTKANDRYFGTHDIQ